jgi:hypothetical protein
VFQLDKLDPYAATQDIKPLSKWSWFHEDWQGAAKALLERIISTSGLSNSVCEIAAKGLVPKSQALQYVWGEVPGWRHSQIKSLGQGSGWAQPHIWECLLPVVFAHHNRAWGRGYHEPKHTNIPISQCVGGGFLKLLLKSVLKHHIIYGDFNGATCYYSGEVSHDIRLYSLKVGKYTSTWHGVISKRQDRDV